MSDPATLAAAMESCREALQSPAHRLQALGRLESIARGLNSIGAYDQAATCFRWMLACAPNLPELHFNLAAANVRLGDLSAAIASMRRSLELGPDNLTVRYHLALTLQKNGDLPQAITEWRALLSRDATNGSAHFHLAAALAQTGDQPQADASLAAARSSSPTALLCNDLGLHHLDQGNLPAAIDDLTRATALDPACSAAWMNLGLALTKSGRLRESLPCFRRAIDLDPGCPEAHWNYSASLLAAGDYTAGFAEYEWRLKCRDFAPRLRKIDRPPWRGQNLRGQSILLHDEQGFGDTLQFIRYAPYLAAAGAGVFVLCHPALVDLLSCVAGIEKVITDGQPCPHVDVHCPIASLPFHFRTTLQTIPATVPYLAPPRARIDRWSAEIPKLQNQLRVGIAWSGRSKPNPDRSIPIALLRPLIGIDGVKFFSLQSHDVRPPPDIPIQDFADSLTDFAAAAALISQMDLVISIDTAAAHLAAAMNKPTWILLPCAADWRWLLDRNDSAWYPSARLFRQARAHDWPGVIDRVATSLKRFPGA